MPSPTGFIVCKRIDSVKLALSARPFAAAGKNVLLTMARAPACQTAYRARQTGRPPVLPVLGPPVIFTAVTLTGHVSDIVQVDWINQFTPDY
jgi:hypothetical protein